jgi:hypothetical protein
MPWWAQIKKDHTHTERERERERERQTRQNPFIQGLGRTLRAVILKSVPHKELSQIQDRGTLLPEMPRPCQ